MRDAIGSADRKARGAFFTPPEIARFISEWAIRTADDVVLEPSCGDAEFLLAAGDRLRDLGAGLLAGEHLYGIELHGPSAATAQKRVADAGLISNIRVGDFFDFSTERRFDAVIGNPPYIRYQDFAGEPRRKALEAALRLGVRLSGLASSWAAFVIHASQFLTPEGRLGMVLPAELLSVNYAAEVRRFLLERFASVRLVMFEQRVFPEVQEEVILLLAEGTGPADFFEVHQARDLTELRHIDRIAWLPYAPGEEEKWLRALLPGDVLAAYQDAIGPGRFESLVDWGRSYLGIVTGNNRFFSLTPNRVRDLGLGKDELLPISPPGSRHLQALTFTERAWSELASDDRAVYLFAPDPESPSSAAREYIAAGQKLKVDQAYKCRVRTPWWRVPLVDVPDLFLTYMDRDRPRIVTNHAGVYHLNSLYGVKLLPSRRQLGMDLLPLAALNSLSLLGSELVGRAYGGGMLKLEPREADRLPVPSESLVMSIEDELRAVRPQLAGALRQGDLARAAKLVDRLVLVKALGLDHGTIQALREAREALFRRRIARSSNGTNR